MRWILAWVGKSGGECGDEAVLADGAFLRVESSSHLRADARL